MYRIGIDVGGTFTDFAAVSESGETIIAKSPSTPADQSRGVMNGLAILADDLGTDIGGLLASTTQITHGTTVATNALLERRGAKVGLLTTLGHRDILEQREGLKPERYNLRLAPEPSLVPRHLRLGVRERVRFDGSIEVPLDEASVRENVARLIEEGVDAVAICYLHAYTNPEHEIATRAIVREMMPDVYISISSEVLPQIKEYERLSTTVVNSFVGKELAKYLLNLQGSLLDAGYRGELLIMHSHGGVGTVPDSIALSAGCVLSGPAGGIAGACYAAELTGVGDLVSFDMGGTSTDIAVIEGGQAPLSNNREVDNVKVALPSIDIHTLGAGGGSIAHVDMGGILHVGPASAGADPGPACYAKGGTKPTVTDANVVLGYYDGVRFLGGQSAFDLEAAQAAVGQVASAMNCSLIQAAEGIQRVVDMQMAEGVRVMAVRRGVDLRKFSLLSFGGAAGLHIVDIARILEVRRVIVPRVASVLSAWGMLATDLRHEFSRSFMVNIREMQPARLREMFSAMENEGRAKLAGRPDDSLRILRSLEMRYGEQIFEINVPLDGLDLGSPSLIEDIVERFHRRHEELYTYKNPNQEVVLVNLNLAVVGELSGKPVENAPVDAPRPSPVGTRRIYSGTWQDVDVFDMLLLGRDGLVEGPAIIESPTTTILLRRGDRALLNAQGWLDIGIGMDDGESSRDRATS